MLCLSFEMSSEEGVLHTNEFLPLPTPQRFVFALQECGYFVRFLACPTSVLVEEGVLRNVEEERT